MGDLLKRLMVRLGLRNGPNSPSGMEGLAELTEVDEDTKLLYAELKSRLERMRAEGFVDLKAFCGRESSVRDKLWALNNVLRLTEEGKTEVVVLES